MTDLTTIKPVLADTADERQFKRLMADEGWGLQQKVDGQRMLIVVQDGKVTVLNRQGQPKQTMVTRSMLDEFARFHGDWCFDAEMVGTTLWLFDLPHAGDYVDVKHPLSWRNEVLNELVGGLFAGSDVKLLPLYTDTDAKQELLQRVTDAGGEGVMLKNMSAAYEPGRRSRHVLKWKLRQTVDCVVTRIKVQGKDNIEVAVFNDRGKLQVIGECTALAGDGAKVQPGDVVEITYLYANDPAAPRLYQPTKPMIRNDKSATECTINQLVFANKKVLA